MDVIERNESTSNSTGTNPPVTVGSLDLTINDAHGDPIHNLSFKVLVDKAEIFSGESDSMGKIKTIENIKLGSVFDIHVKTDKGEYKKVATGKVDCEETYACLTSPKTRFEFSTFVNAGSAGTAAENKENVFKKHNQTPAIKPVITGNPDTKPSIKDDLRDKNGHPVAAVIDGQTNWLGVNNDKAALPPQDSLDKLHTLVDFMEHQAKLDYTKLGKVATDDIIKKMIKKTFKEPASKLPTASKGRCNIYAKVGLWYAGYGPATEAIGNGVVPAKDMGSALGKKGADFTNISASLPKVKITVGNKSIEQPDITFALPGDVIVYKERADPTAAGHIDVRTYHGFISDFVWPARNGFPDVRQYTVTGVYRKFSDTLAKARVDAFLRIIREHVTKGADDPYRALDKVGDKYNTFTDMLRHPSNEKEDKLAGAYQILWSTFKDDVASTGWPNSFTPLDQDRAAIFELQRRSSGNSYPRRTALGYIMEDKIEQAITETNILTQYDFLPGGGKTQLIDMNTLKQKFEKYTLELSK